MGRFMDTENTIPRLRLVGRTPFDRWLWDRDVSNVEAARLLGRHPMTIARWRLPFSDDRRRTPDRNAVRDIISLTDGEIGRRHFDPPVDFSCAYPGGRVAVAGGRRQ
jgi:hypothetical protein